MRVTNQREPRAGETCSATQLHPVGYYDVPDRFLEPLPLSLVIQGGTLFGLLSLELVSTLEEFADDPTGLLASAANRYDRGEIELAFALADTIATGRRGHAFLRDGGVSYDDLVARARQPDSSNIEDAVRDILERVYRVAWTLEGLAPREDFGWLGVCALTDPPRRPVNVPGSAPYPQFDIRVAVRASGAASAQTVETRFLVCRNGLRPQSTRPMEEGIENNQLPTLVLPEVAPDERIVLFVHGHSSRAEEALTLAEQLIPFGYTVIAVDLPGTAYATPFDPPTVGPPPEASLAAATTGPYSALDFTEQFLSDFVAGLDELFGTPVSRQIVGVMGGSLGGNLSLRLAQRRPYAAWRQSVAAWSSASVWGLSWARARHAVSEADEYYDFAKSESVRVSRDRMNQVEDDARMANRVAYFKQVFYGYEAIGPQADRWYREGWEPCKTKYKAGAEDDRKELYAANYRRWHWRVAYEQLCFMHQEPPVPDGLPRFETIHSRVLFAAGGEDNETPGENLWDNSIDLAEQMVHVQGHTMFVTETGHAIVAERPRELAIELARYLPTHSPEVTGAEPFGGWRELGGDALLPESLAVGVNEDGRLELFGIRVSDRRIVSQRQERINGSFPEAFEDIGVRRGVPAGVTFDSRLAVAPLHGGTLRLYAQRADQNGWVVHFTQREPNGAMVATDLGNDHRQLLGGVTVGPVVCERLGWNRPANNPQRLHLVAGLLQDRELRIRGQTVFEFPDRYWHEQPDFSTQSFSGAPALGRFQNGLMLIAGRRSSDGEIYFRAESSEDDWSTDWLRVAPGRATSDPTLARDWDGNLNLFVTGDGAEVWQATHDRGTGRWGPWVSLGGRPAPGARPTAVLDPWGGLEVFVRTADGRLAYRRQVPTRDFEWTPWVELDGPLTSDPIVAANVNGTLSVFGLDENGRAQVISQSHPWTYGSERSVFGASRDGDGDIVALCNPAEPWSPRPVSDVIADIESGTHTYFTVADGGAAEIQVVEGPRGPYLRTRPDAAPANNLDALPDC